MSLTTDTNRPISLAFVGERQAREKIYDTTLHLKAWRNSRRWTLQQLADIMGVTRSTLSELENGHMHVTEEWLDRFAEAYQVSRTRFFYPPNRPSLDVMIEDVPEAMRETLFKMVAAAAGQKTKE